ncbi:MAG: GNAT family N-acetyltransferase [Acidobacteriia bacterium]|nr:GNAT family N-acetyltransferase [Terriglobia bacterium]
MRARKARRADAGAIHRLITHYAAQGLLLPRGEEEIHRDIGHFLVLEEKGQVTSCVALESYGPTLAEVRSLAVDPGNRGRSAGSQLIEFAFAEARRRGVAQLFAVTHAPEFFQRHGFEGVRRQSLLQKTERDCRACPKRRACKLVGVIATVIPERIAVPALGVPARHAAAL